MGPGGRLSVLRRHSGAARRRRSGDGAEAADHLRPTGRAANRAVSLAPRVHHREWRAAAGSRHRRAVQGAGFGGLGSNPKLQIPNPNHSQLPRPKELPSSKIPTKRPSHPSVSRPGPWDLGLGIWPWDLALGFGSWEWLGFGAWSLGFDRSPSQSVLSSTALPSIPSDRAVVLSRVTRRLIPFAFICYVIAYIDRVNIGFAQRELQRDLGLSDTEYGIGAGLFFLGYCLFEIPSNLILERVGARRWIARIMIGWGLVSIATMFITDVWSFMTARVVLGIAEAGFFPGMVLYLTYWIPAAERAKANALFMMAAPVSVIVGAPVSEALLAMDGIGGL